MKYTTLITDFDNTLYDWFQMWHQSFSVMLKEIQRISGLSENELIPEIRTIHQRHGTSEYSRLIEDLPCLKAKFPNQDLSEIFDEAIHAYRRARKANLQLYSGVLETLTRLRSMGVLIVLYTDSLAYYTNFRIRRLELDSLLDFVFSPRDHELPAGTKSHTENEDARLVHAKHIYLPQGVRKPDKAALLDIIGAIGRSPQECIYVGDSLKNDIMMAQDAGVSDVWAEYGGVQHHPEYDLLRRVSHWTEADVEREKSISKRTITSTNTISSFGEVVRLFGGSYVTDASSQSSAA
jgi:HAD superfamily hydrolase (TIGR01549 family)